MKVLNKVLVVTGAGSGMGRAVAEELVRRGARVAAADVRPEGLARTATLAGAGTRLSTHVLDISDRAAVAELPDMVLTTHGRIDGVINNAGIIQPFVPVADLDLATIEHVLDVNLMGTVYMVKAFLPYLLERPVGHIANVSSMGGFLPVPGQSIYGASKAAVKLLTEGLYAELLDTSVGVSVVLPGAVDTNITENSGVAMPSLSGPSAPSMTSAPEAARMIVDGIENNRLYVFVGRDSRLMNVATRIAPRRASLLVRRQLKGLLAPT